MTRMRDLNRLFESLDGLRPPNWRALNAPEGRSEPAAAPSHRVQAYVVGATVGIGVIMLVAIALAATPSENEGGDPLSRGRLPQRKRARWRRRMFQFVGFEKCCWT